MDKSPSLMYRRCLLVRGCGAKKVLSGYLGLPLTVTHTFQSRSGKMGRLVHDDALEGHHMGIFDKLGGKSLEACLQLLVESLVLTLGSTTLTGGNQEKSSDGESVERSNSEPTFSDSFSALCLPPFEKNNWFQKLLEIQGRGD